MGRKPNPLILAHFHRGDKLSDASNRYQYTCKGCGGEFPKGRTEVLFTHITTKCPAMSDEQRMHISLIANESKHIRQPRSNKPAPENRTSSTQERPKLTGLEALAEASRRVGHAGQLSDDNFVIDPSLQDYEQVIQNQLAASLGFIPNAVCSAESLSNIAASANNLEESLPRQESATMPELPQEPVGDHQINPVEALDESQDFASSATWPAHPLPLPSVEEVARAATFPQTAASLRKGPLRINSGNGERSMRAQRIRGKFTDSRRKEVLEIRKKGACIRCRVLRKTCSGGDPCNTCASVETARLWKTPCMRTRLSKAFELYADDPFEKIASNNIEALNSNFFLKEGLVRISLCHSRDSLNGINFTTRIAIPQSLASTAYEAFPRDAKYAILASEMERGLSQDLENMLYVSSSRIHHQEPYEVVRCSLKEAQCLVSKNKQDTVISGAIYLWDLTHFLTSSPEEWTVSALESITGSGTNREAAQDMNGHVLTCEQSTILFIQLRSLASKLAMECFTSLLNAIEALLVRPPASTNRFSSFLSAFCVLASIERMEAWIRGFNTPDVVEDDKVVDSKQWPLPKPPSYYVSQASSFADILSTLLKLRGVPPRFYRGSETDVLVPAPGAKTRRSGDDAVITAPVDEDAARWFKEAKLTVAFLKERKNKAEFDAGDVRTFELKYCARLLI